MAHDQTITAVKDIDRAAKATGVAMLRLPAAVFAALAAVALIGLGLPYPGAARFALIVLALAVVGWTLLDVDDTLVAMAAAAALLLGGAVPIAALPAAMTNPLIGLLLGSFLIAAALVRSGLAERVVLAAIGSARSVQRLFHRLALVITASAFVVPSTTARAALFLPVFLMLAVAIRDERVVRAMALIIPSVVLLSACASLTGAGAHLVAVEFITRSGGAPMDYGRWAMIGLPIALASSVAATTAILRLFLDRETRLSAPDLPAAPREPLDRRQRAVAIVIAGTAAALLGAAAAGFDPAFAALAAAAVLVVGPLAVVPPAAVPRAIEWKLLAFLIASMVMGEALVGSGAAHAVTASLVAGFGDAAAGSPLAVAVFVTAVALLSHLVVPSRTSRAVILVPVLVLPLTGLGYDATALVLLIAFGTGFCQTMPVSAKAVALYAGLRTPTFAPKDLMVLSGVLLPVLLVLLVGFALLVWPLFGIALR